MSNGFFFNKTFNVTRCHSDGTTEDFTVNGMFRMKSMLDQQNGNFPVTEVLFVFAPDREIMLGDRVCFDDCCCRIGRVEPICDLDGNIQAYRVESI